MHPRGLVVGCARGRRQPARGHFVVHPTWTRRREPSLRLLANVVLGADGPHCGRTYVVRRPWPSKARSRACQSREQALYAAGSLSWLASDFLEPAGSWRAAFACSSRRAMSYGAGFSTGSEDLYFVMGRLETSRLAFEEACTTSPIWLVEGGIAAAKHGLGQVYRDLGDIERRCTCFCRSDTSRTGRPGNASQQRFTAWVTSSSRIVSSPQRPTLRGEPLAGAERRHGPADDRILPGGSRGRRRSAWRRGRRRSPVGRRRTPRGSDGGQAARSGARTLRTADGTCRRTPFDRAESTRPTALAG